MTEDRRRWVELGVTASTDDCIIMPTQRGNPRPLARLAGRTMTAARAVWWAANGDPGGLHVLHRCGDGSGATGCININHLYLGTVQENMRDRNNAGRQARGEDNWKAKLTEEAVRAIRVLYAEGGVTQESLAAQFGVKCRQISNVIHRRSWAHVD